MTWKPSVIILSVLSALMVMAGCSQNTSAPTPPKETSAATQALGPVIFAPDDLDGASISISLDFPLVINVGEDALTDWVGEVADQTVASFVPGEVRDGVQFNPAFEGHREGTTDAVLIGPGGARITFTISVVNDNRDVTLNVN